MCDICDALEKASRIDNINADTSLKLAKAAAELREASFHKQADLLADAAVSYFKESKEAASEELLKGSRESGETISPREGQPGTSAPLEGPVWSINPETGEVFIKNTLLGKFSISKSLFGYGDAVFFQTNKH